MWTKEKIHELLDSNPMAVMKALVVIYDRQSESEKNSQVTTLANGVGFSAFDAKFCSNLAERIKKSVSAKRVPVLSPRQLAIAKNKMKRYHRQLCELANSKVTEK
ncbi:hypothetical protein [Ferrovum sp.]|uniref:hypothetical protein n=1 Tax=Ferrovum sp. TaxID=2609467 RepID=UPI0026372783|nr:hypothetical protein [Ferrovum sp.]